MKRRSPIAHTLIKNSKSAMMAAIEIHNKPNISFRYETVIILIINAWELVLKAYIHKYLKNVKLFNSDGKTKPLPECISCVFSNLNKTYLPTKNNIELLYDYRNEIAHFYSGYLDPLIFLLVRKNIIFFIEFIKKFFNQDLTKETSLLLLPIGFKQPYSPLEYFVDNSKNENHPKIIKQFLEKIIKVTQEMHKKSIEDSIITDYTIGLINEKRIKNADIIVALSSNQQIGHKSVVFKKEEIISNIILTRDKTKATGTYYHEKISDILFDDINNVIETNSKLSHSKNEFHLDKELYYRIYSERELLSDDKSTQLLLAKTSLSKYYAPGLYWILKLDKKIFAKLLLDNIDTIKSPYVTTFLRIIILLGEEITDWAFEILNNKWKNISQPPNYYFTFKNMEVFAKESEKRISILKQSSTSSINIAGQPNPHKLIDLINNFELSKSLLTKVCDIAFKGSKEAEYTARVLDIITYGDLLQKKSSGLLDEIKKIN